MSDNLDLEPIPADSDPTAARSSRRKIARRAFIGSTVLAGIGAGWWLKGAVQDARHAAQRSNDR